MYSRTKTPHPPTRLQVYIDRLRFVLGVVAVLAIAVTFVLNNQADVAQNERITKIESPCLRYGSESRQCQESFQAAIDSITDYQLCELLAKRPDITRVDDVDCRRIAQEAKQRAEDRRAVDQEAGRSTQNSDSGSSPKRRADNQPGVRNEPPANEAAPEGGSGPNPGNQAGGQPEASPAPKGNHTPPPQAGPTPSPSPQNQSGSSGGQVPKPAQESPISVPPIVEVEASGLPAQACVPGVLSINCPR